MTTTTRTTAAGLAAGLILAACGGGSSGNGAAANGGTGPATPLQYQVAGTVTGLQPNAQLSLLDNGGDAVTVGANGRFSFPTALAPNAAYAVTIGQQPYWQWCAVANGSGSAAANVSNVAVTCAPQRSDVTTLAGFSWNGAQGIYADGPVATAQFSVPQGVAADGQGNVYVTTQFNPVIRRIAPDGTVSALAGTNGARAWQDGIGASARFQYPFGIVADARGNLYVADHGTLRKVTPDGIVTTLAGSLAAGSANGTGSAAQFRSLSGLAIDGAGNLYATDVVSNNVRKITPAGVVTTLAGDPAGNPGWVDGQGTAARFSMPHGIAADGSGNVYVADQGGTIRKIDATGMVTTIAGKTNAFGYVDGSGANARFGLFLQGLAVDALGNLYVGDNGNSLIRKLTPDASGTAYTVSTWAGSGVDGSGASPVDGIGSAARVAGVLGLAFDAGGNLYVADGANNAIRKIVPVP